jgi:uncharacterized protein (DUF58 family)
MLSAIKNFINQQFNRWLDRRIPPIKSITLDQRRIFIFPSKAGGAFMLLLLTMLVAAINYQNNMAFALVFLLVSVFIVSILHTFANLSGLTIATIKTDPIFAGDNAGFELSVSRQGDKEYFDINLSMPGSEVRSVTLTEKSQQLIDLHLVMNHRGLYKPERLLIETFYPVGLLRSWTWLAMDTEVLVYPRPLKCALEGISVAGGDDDGEVIPIVGSDDFYQFQQYQPGDSLKHVFWKIYAKGQALQTKQFASFREQRLWLDWQQFTGGEEDRLSKLCYWVLQLENNNDEYGLRLPSLEIAPGHGLQHQAQVLKALALYRCDVNQFGLG